jgi:hypothetical protein
MQGCKRCLAAGAAVNPLVQTHETVSASMMSVEWPELSPGRWQDTYDTLHMWAQIVGKTRLALAPMENHWWQVALYVTVRGLATSPMPLGHGTVAVEFDFISHELIVQTGDGAKRSFALTAMTVADFFARYLGTLRDLGIDPAIYPSPVEVKTAIPFAQDSEHAGYAREAAHNCWQILVNTQRVMTRFRSRFTGKQSPIHFFWGSFDLAATRFSGRRAPKHPGGAPHCPDRVMIEAYSHECSSCGFWPGDETHQPSFYAYAYPQPQGYAERLVEPAAARYDLEAREFLLQYEALRATAEPDEMLLRFFQTTYEAAADLGRWDRAALDRAT